MIYVVLLDAFGGSRAATAWVGALSTGILEIGAVLSGVLVARTSARFCALVGAPPPRPAARCWMLDAGCCWVLGSGRWLLAARRRNRAVLSGFKVTVLSYSRTREQVGGLLTFAGLFLR